MYSLYTVTCATMKSREELYVDNGPRTPDFRYTFKARPYRIW